MKHLILKGILLSGLIYFAGFNGCHAATIETRLTGTITEASVLPVLKVLQSAKEGDTVSLRIESRGGSVLAGSKILEAMRESKAKAVVALVPKHASSMAAEIALSADALVVTHKTELLIHCVSLHLNGEKLRIMPYGGNEREVRLKHGKEADVLMYLSDLVFARTASHAAGLFSAGDLINVIRGDDVTKDSTGFIRSKSLRLTYHPTILVGEIK